MRKNKKQKILWISLIISLLIFIYLAAARHWQFFPFSQKVVVTEPESSQSKLEPKEKQASDTIKQTPANTNQSEPTREAEKDLPGQYEGPNPNESESLTGVITHKTATDGQLILRTLIHQTLSSGSCTLKLISPSKTVTETVPIISNPSSSTCEGFNIPLSKLASGSWQIEIKLNSGGKTGTLKGAIDL